MKSNKRMTATEYILNICFCLSESIEALYCFRYSQGVDDLPREAGWSLFDLQIEFERMGVPNETWSMSLLNKDYEVTFQSYKIKSSSKFILF